MNLTVKVYAPGVELPKYETSGAACMDVKANANITLQPKETKLIPTGLYVAIPEGFALAILPRSGMSLKTGFRVVNSPARVDSDYRGEVQIIGQNTHGSLEIHINKGERIAQLELVEVNRIVWQSVDSTEALGATVRGEGGFGSSGAN